MKITNVLSIFTILHIFEVCASYRILGIYGLPIRSHFIFINEVFKGLIEKGHKVDIISTLSHVEANPNYTQIIKLPVNNRKSDEGLSFDIALRINIEPKTLSLIGNDICKYLGNEEFLKLAFNPPKDPPYDVIVTQMANYHCVMILGHLWNIPVVLISTTSLYPWMHDMIGNPENIAYSSSNLAEFNEATNFFNRFYNAYIFYKFKFSYLYYSLHQDELLQKYFGPNIPSIRELEKTVSLVLVNSYFPINGAKSSMTGVIEVGGLHIQNKSPELTNDLKKWLDESKNGVIYFSFGSALRIETFPEKILTIIFKSLENVAPTRVLLKLSKPEQLSIKIPENFYVLPWIPQQKVLEHPNTRVFITHGGLLGTQEALHFGVPMLCVPIYADQFTNSRTYVEKKIAIIVEHNSLTQDKFDNAINELLNNPTYKENVKTLSSLFKDRPMNPKDTATFWIEYVIRNGKHSLRSEAMNLTWWQLSLLDVYSVALIIFLTILVTVVFIVKKLLCLLVCAKKTIISMEKKCR